MSPLPPDFTFSQNNLQDFVDCPRRFELRYVLKQAWPAIRSEPVLEQEKNMQRGSLFHRMVQQHQMGLVVEKIALQTNDSQLLEWWQNYLESSLPTLPALRFPEFTLQASLNQISFIAKLDLLAVDPGKKWIIVDWKTGYKKPSRAFLRARIQTRIYPWIVAAAGQTLQNGQPVRPEQVEMIYWFSAAPERPEVFPYSDSQFANDEKHLTQLVEQVQQAAVMGFPLTDDERRCAYCNYRSLCERGISAGKAVSDEFEESLDDGFDLDFDQAETIAF